MNILKSQLYALSNKSAALISALNELPADNIATYQSCENCNAYINHAKSLFLQAGWPDKNLPQLVNLEHDSLPQVFDLKQKLNDLKCEIDEAAFRLQDAPAPSVHDQGDYLTRA